ncbi:unnamed protein product [Peniophora sp. CBMAI 1063]|nr:unnamed protein product [Peniophora sp. CBMAI 1063]
MSTPTNSTDGTTTAATIATIKDDSITKDDSPTKDAAELLSDCEKALRANLQAQRDILNAIMDANHVIGMARCDAETALFDAEDALLRAADPDLMRRTAEIIDVLVHGDDDMSDSEQGIGDFPQVLEKVLALRRRLGLPIVGEDD